MGFERSGVVGGAERVEAEREGEVNPCERSGGFYTGAPESGADVAWERYRRACGGCDWRGFPSIQLSIYQSDLSDIFPTPTPSAFKHFLSKPLHDSPSETDINTISKTKTQISRKGQVITGLDTRSAPCRRQRIGSEADNPDGTAVDGWTASADWLHHQERRRHRTMGIERSGDISGAERVEVSPCERSGGFYTGAPESGADVAWERYRRACGGCDWRGKVPYATERVQSTMELYEGVHGTEGRDGESRQLAWLATGVRPRPWPTKLSLPPGSVNWYQRSLGGWSTGLVHRMPPASHCTGHIRIQRLYDAQMKSNAHPT
ncbi:hypothetical protein Y032_0054g2491 [Ancylostoma ceylanicum]|uniref:Uncharacterized protein n=1 Tax=Ancylostoma ceylanicum TaxID=53326 RepID=A0A016U757_9BILA|nr:hypothetical protein Y032_0054g2491 [Ancylostoma ceylanicum]